MIKSCNRDTIVQVACAIGLAFLLAPFGFSARIDENPKVKALAAAVDRHYNSLETFKADFNEIYSGGGISRNESGTLLLKRPSRMRWDYHQPREKLFVSDGKTAYFYVIGERQARKTPVKKLDDLRSPLRYLLGKTRLEREFDQLQFADGVTVSQPGNVVLSGVPKNMDGRISRVLLEITPASQIQRIVIEEVDGTSTEFRFSNFEENKPISEKQFSFTAPLGVEMVEAGDLQGE